MTTMTPLMDFVSLSLRLHSQSTLKAALRKVTNEYGSKKGKAKALKACLPPGPRGLPIVGCFPYLTKYPEKTLDRWAKIFGNLYSMWLGNQLFVIVSDPKTAKDLMVTNGAIFSSRKEMYIKSQTVFAGRGITATPYNERWKKPRRLAFTWLSQKAVDGYTHVLDSEATEMLRCIHEASKGGPVNPQVHAGRYSLNNMLTITFGTRSESIDDPIVKDALRLSREFMNCTGPMSNLIDFVPLLQCFEMKLKRRAKELHSDLVKTYGGMIDNIRQRLVSGEAVDDCLAKDLVGLQEEEDLDQLDMAILASAFMIGGVETTASIMQWFSALIPAYPEVQKRAQQELDAVVGRERLPTVEDESNLPYCHAIVKEVERCHNPFWLGTPHVASSDFVYHDKFIPKGTVIVLNTWTMHHSERYADPGAFNPDRYLNDQSTSGQSANLADPHARDHWMFGAGRRICPGILVAEREIWLTISRMLWAFKMKEIPDKPIDLTEYDGLSGRSPVPFEIEIIPRHGNVEKLLQA